MVAVFRFFARVCALAALLPAFSVCRGAEVAPPPVKFGRRIVCAGEYPGHLQGMATDGEHIYWVFTRTIVKTGLDGKVVAKRVMKNHCGDPCWHEGKLFVPVCGSGFNRKLPEGTPSKNFIHVFDAGLKPLAVHPVPELEFGVGGIAVRDGHFFIVGGRPKDLPGNTVYEYDAAFKPVRRHEVAFDSLKGIQTINYASGRWYLGCYGTKLLTIETDGNFKVLRRLRPGTSVGMIPLDRGLVLVGRIVKGKAHNRKRGAAQAVRFTVPVPEDPPPAAR